MRPPCRSAKCKAEAVVFAHWPSAKGPVMACLPCASRALHTAEVMGFKLPLQPIDEEARAILLEELHAHQARVMLGSDE